MTTFTELFIWLYAFPIVILMFFNSWFKKDLTKQEHAQFKLIRVIPFMNILLCVFMIVAWGKYQIEVAYEKFKKK